MTEILKAIIFGIVEGITEWLPISSTGHMILLNEFLTLDVSAQFWDMFLVVIQLGAILAVVVLFWNLIWPFARSSSEAVVAAGQNEKSGSLAKREYWVLGPVTVRMPVIINWCKIVVSCLPAIVFVVLGLDETCDRLFYNPVCVCGGTDCVRCCLYSGGESQCSKAGACGADAGHYVSDGDSDRFVPAARGCVSGNIALRCNDYRCALNRCVKEGCE